MNDQISVRVDAAERGAALTMPPGVVLIAVGSTLVLVDVVSLQRTVIPASVAPLLEAVRDRPHTPGELKQLALRQGWDVDVLGVLEQLREKGMLVPAAQAPARDLEALIRLQEQRTPTGASAAYSAPDVLDLTARSGVELTEQRQVLLIGGCVAQFAADPLRKVFRERGIGLDVTHRWPAVRGQLARMCQEHGRDLVVVQPHVQTFLAGLWDDGIIKTPAERERRLTTTIRALRATVSELADAVGGGLGLVHNVAPPALSPYGRYEFAVESNLRSAVYQINEALDDCVRQHPNLALVDEERLVRYWGAKTLFDDTVFPFSHHGGSLDPGIEAPHQLPALGEALALEYFACYQAHTGRNRVKCIAVDPR